MKASFNFAARRAPEPWEDQQFTFSSNNTLPPLAFGSAVSFSLEHEPDCSIQSYGNNHLHSFNFLSPRPREPPGPLAPLQLSSGHPFSQSAPPGAGSDQRLPLGPLARFYHDEENPWVPIVDQPPERSGGPSQSAHANFDVRAYRSAPQSELESIGTGVYQSDSGYYTHSVKSGEPVDRSQDIPSQLIEQVSNCHFNTFPQPTMAPMSAHNPDQADTQHAPRAPTSRSKGPLKTCTLCGETPKCPSDFK